jgi:hypothetical protein
VIALATIVNLVVATMLFNATSRAADIAQQVFEAAHRPYVGIDSFDTDMDTERHTLTVTAQMKNYGTAPAEHNDAGWQEYLNGVAQVMSHLPTGPRTLFPGQIAKFTSGEGEPIYSQIMTGSSTLEFVIYASYKGPGGKSYSYREKYRYDPSVNGFRDIGPPEK